MGSVGSSVFGALPIQVTKGQDITASAEYILTIFFLTSVSFKSTNFMEMLHLSARVLSYAFYHIKPALSTASYKHYPFHQFAFHYCLD